ncbi:TPA: hypothetical protein ND688_000568 [Pseudomonas aeruginosa]|uniref:hypothetical protein n=1 Tax=Pseudomonas aeruginosa TaxID=287 RepID=UPI00106DB73F|nr:hypothetical protein [Pseudomonas aeruginosa]TQH34875.1 hypothetical protein FLI64_00675 [Pseudomonas aeruginosa]HBO4202835.1 hypothetical protein [Pseudomonas aeruginosa]HCD6603140.1 hypothetical protein [Pseudomonas aeruginosa]HCD7429421.1 hypothetical protein [Pseudomonas aeruginosa]HCD8076745.1 hypothetical protein [Pseudomonas aeruginosa]
MKVKVGDRLLARHDELPGLVFTFQVIAKSVTDGGSDVFLAAKISKNSFITGGAGMSVAWFDCHGQEIDPVLAPGYQIDGRSRAKQVPLDKDR